MSEKLLKGEGETEIVIKMRVRHECHICGEPAQFKHSFLLEGARRNPASSAYGKDDCSWCSDTELFVCKEHEKERTPPDGYSWCSTFTASDRFANMFLYWQEKKQEKVVGIFQAMGIDANPDLNLISTTNSSAEIGKEMP